MTRISTLLAAAALAAFSYLPAEAQQARCMARDDLVSFLTGRFSETRLMVLGNPERRQTVEVWAADNAERRQSWTIVLNRPAPDGSVISCIMGAGGPWAVVDETEPVGQES